jgi:rare lipoprotein A
MTEEGLPPAPSAAALLEAGYDAYAELPLDAAAATASALPAEQPYEPVHWMQTGIASTYGGKFHGRLTASGERFNSRALTAAHRVLKFGTRVRVTRASNGLSIIVRVNDRGPYHGNRIIDLSTAAAIALGMHLASVMLVTIEALPD